MSNFQDVEINNDINKFDSLNTNKEQIINYMPLQYDIYNQNNNLNNDLLYSFSNNNKNNSSNFHRRELSDSEKLLIEKYTNTNYRDNFNNFNDIENYSCNCNNNETPLINQNFNNDNIYNYNSNYLGNNLNTNKDYIDHQDYFLENNNIYPIQATNQIYNNNYNDLSFPSNQDLNNINIYNYNNKYRNMKHFNTMKNTLANKYFNNSFSMQSQINYDNNNNSQFSTFKNINNFYRRNSEIASNNIFNNNFDDSIPTKNNLLSKTQNVLNNFKLDNYHDNDNNNNNKQFLFKKNYSSNNIFDKRDKYNLTKDVHNNNSNIIINNSQISDYISYEKNINKNKTPIRINFDNIKLEKKYNSSFTPSNKRKQKISLRKEISDNSIKKNISDKSTQTPNYINTKNKSIKTYKYKINNQIIKPYKYISGSSVSKINNKNASNKMNRNEENSKMDKIKRKYSSTTYKNSNGKYKSKIKTIPKEINTYYYRTYQIESNKKSKRKINLFNYSSILTNLINKNSKSFF